MEDITPYTICPVCGQEGKYGTLKDVAVELRAKNKKIIYCDNNHEPVWVSLHANGEPMGYMADEELRSLRTKVHYYFDLLWKEGLTRRKSAYSWLAVELGLTNNECHISRLTKEQCEKAIALSMFRHIELKEIGIVPLEKRREVCRDDRNFRKKRLNTKKKFYKMGRSKSNRHRING